MQSLFCSVRVVAPLFFSAVLTVAGCGGSGGSPAPRPTPPTTTTPPPSTGPTWTSGVFADAGQFEQRCEVVRTGVDLEGNSFPDRPGSTLEENFWLRSWTNETYLWNTEVVDQNPASFNNRLDYFAVLRTTAQTSSGKDKDDFHFSQPTEEFLAQRNSAPTADYGARFVSLSTTPPRDIRVLYTEPNSPASQEVAGQPNFVRGARVIEIDGIDAINGGATQADLDTLNNGLFPLTAGEIHSFRVRDPDGTERNIMLTSANLAPKPVNRFTTIDTAAGKVGYMLINTFSPFASEEDIATTIADLKTAGVSDLVLDLRYNGGGLLAVAAQLGYMVAGPSRTNGKTFERLQFNAAAGGVDPVTNQTNTPVPFYSTGQGFTLAVGAALETLNLSRVYILSTGRTCSASEAVINGLRGIDVEVVLIGDTTCGKPFGFYPTDNCGETYYTIQFRGVNDKNFGDYADGFIPMNSNASFGVSAPGCAVADDLSKELGDPAEALLAAALQYREDGTCPAPPPVASAVARSSVATRSVDEGGAMISDAGRSLDIFQTNRDMTLPN